MNRKRLDKVSRQLTCILRHKIIELGLECDEKGFVDVVDIQKIIPDLTIEDLCKIVDTNEKKRFELIEKDGKYFIRAVQGHNKDVGSLLDDDKALELILEPLENCIHGTKDTFIDSIIRNGLSRMSRKHIHFVSEIKENDQTSGYKKESNILVFIDMKKCMEDGIKFYKSKNNVILTEETIPPENIKLITGR